MKILAIKFKFLGDVAVTVPALRALREAYPKAKLEVLVSEEAVPILKNIPWIDKVWGYPRKKNQGTKKDAFSIIKALRKEKFNLSVDFVGNDRGAWMSLVIGAKIRLGPTAPRGFWGRKYCYTLRVPEASNDMHEIDRLIQLLSPIGIKAPTSVEPELYSTPQLSTFVQKYLPSKAILCHLSASVQSKEWSIQKWVDFYNICPELQTRFLFTSGPSERERALLKHLSKEIPNVPIIAEILNLEEFMALIDHADAVVCADTFIAHAAAGLKTPLVVIFGPTIPKLWDPKGNSIIVETDSCQCRHFFYKCTNDVHCLSELSANKVKEKLMQVLERTKNCGKIAH